MPSRLADRQIRAAAALAAPTLDVRGPVSEALGRAGITVPPAPVDAPEATPASTPAPASGRSIGRPTVPGLKPTVKPFEEAAWPTRRAAGPEAAPLSGLTPDERRVHRILLDALDLANEQGDYGTGLSYAEKKRLGVLDLAFINAEIAKMNERTARTAEFGRLGLLATLFLAPLGLGIALVAGAGIEAALVALAVLGAVSAGLLAQSAATPASSQRRKIYHALRELALLVDDAPVSEAVAQADALIDRLADPAPASGTAARPARTRIRS